MRIYTWKIKYNDGGDDKILWLDTDNSEDNAQSIRIMLLQEGWFGNNVTFKSIYIYRISIRKN